jgi:putative membrane protein
VRDDPVTVAEVVTPSELGWAWSAEPVLVASLALTAVVYGRGRARLGRRVARSNGKHRAAAFYAGLAVLAGALMSPLDALSSALFSAHMVQHLLLMLVAAPLLAYARPAAALVAGLPAGGRDAARGIRGYRWRAAARVALNPLVVWTVGVLVLWTWHLPALYEAALTNEPLHILEHASFLGAAMLFWSVVLASGARRGVSRPVALLLVLASSVQSSALGAVLLLTPRALYPVHATGARVWEVSLVGDQHVAGGLMWGPPTLLYVVVMGWLVVRWFAEMEEPPSEPLLATAGELA